MQILRSVLAVVAGIVAVVALSLASDETLKALHIGLPDSDPNAFTPAMLALATAYRNVFAVIGSFIAARLAPRAAMMHALSLGILGFFANIAGAIVHWDEGNHWYPIALAVTALPCSWLGGKLAGAKA
jgi:hypothetical protein